MARAYIPDPDHGNSILTTGSEVAWSPYWAAMLALGNYLAVASTPAISPVPAPTQPTASAPAPTHTQAQLDAAVVAATAPLQAQVAALQAQIAAGVPTARATGQASTAVDNALSPSLDLASGSLLI